SRRRHTRWPRDWSSDVCSSDLLPQEPQSDGREGDDGEQTGAHEGRGGDGRDLVEDEPDLGGGDDERQRGGLEQPRRDGLAAPDRSEERRVGKECRARGRREEVK